MSEKKMKIQCDVCERAPATVICCADEAALCAKCDVEVHAANKLASKHQRLLLQCLSNKLPPCDICQVSSFLPLSFHLIFQFEWFDLIHVFDIIWVLTLFFCYVRLPRKSKWKIKEKICYP